MRVVGSFPGRNPPADGRPRPGSASPRDYSAFLSRLAPSMIGCHPETSETMNPSMRRSSGALSPTVDL